MKKITLLLIALVTTFSLFAQNTSEILWKIGASNANLNINQGDTVVWIWDDDLTHTVTNLPESAEKFDSDQLTGKGTTFSHTFNTVGDFPYKCNVHPTTMFGSISVRLLGVDELEKEVLTIYPNPVFNKLIISSPELINKVSITNVLGKKVFDRKIHANKLHINMSNYRNGMYFIQIESGDKINTYRIIKK